MKAETTSETSHICVSVYHIKVQYSRRLINELFSNQIVKGLTMQTVKYILRVKGSDYSVSTPVSQRRVPE